MAVLVFIINAMRIQIMSLETADRKILVFLPQPAARSIVIRLGQHGYAAVAMSTIPDVFEALRANEFIFAVTTRPDITLLRNIRAIPVINLEIFFHAGPTDNGSVSGKNASTGKHS
ncbi:hypothetical protein [Rhizobium sp. SYY.PMSO]|uniref:hypothetical protein n=1 Tax=Rhizobium sp. SYY.PMSO TaxID=3382192 RepID=UPI00398F9503